MRHTLISTLILGLGLAVLGCGEKKAQMVLTFSPDDANVTIDGYRPASLSSPHTFDFFKPGTYRLEVSREGYVPVAMMIKVAADDVLTQSVHLVKKDDDDDAPTPIAVSPVDTVSIHDRTAPIDTEGQQPGDNEFTLYVNSNPPGATVTVQTPSFKSILTTETPGKQMLQRQLPWVVTVSMAGYDSVKRTIVAPADRDEVSLDITLSKTGHTGHGGGHSPVVQIPIHPPDPRDQTDRPPPPVDDQGFLSVNTTPWTEVTLDGKKIGHTPLVRFPVSKGNHKVLLENRNLSKRKVLTVHVSAGEHIRMVQEL